MKKIILGIFLFAATLLFNSNAVNAQSFEQGDFNIGGGIGVGSTLGGGLPFSAHVEYGITDAISIGGYAAFASYNSGVYKWTYTIFGARGAYHFGDLLSLPDNFDLYGGAGLYMYGVKVDNGYGGGLGDGVHFGVHAGARYYFSDKLGAFVDLGNGIAYLQLGVTFKI